MRSLTNGALAAMLVAAAGCSVASEPEPSRPEQPVVGWVELKLPGMT